MEKSLLRKSIAAICSVFFFGIMAIPVKADAAPVPFYAAMTLWPLILAVLVVIIAIFLYRKFKK
jgi:hypothetical protein